MVNSETKKGPRSSSQKKAKPNMASNKMKAVLLAGSLWVTVMGGQALAFEKTSASMPIETDVNTVDVNTVGISGLAVQAAMPLETLTASTNISDSLLSAVPMLAQNRVELVTEPLNYTLPKRASIGLGTIAPVSVGSSQVTSIDLSAAAISPIDVRVPVAVAAVPAEINLNLAPIPKAINPPAVEVSIQPVTATKSSR